MLIDSGGMDESDLTLPSPLGDKKHSSKLPLVPDSNKLALQHLISRAVPQHELPSVIETVFSNVKAADVVKCLQESDAQTFIDVLDEAGHRYSIAEELIR